MDPSSVSIDNCDESLFPGMKSAVNPEKDGVFYCIDRYKIRFPCSSCSCKFRTKRGLSSHVKKSHSSTKAFICKICGEKCSSYFSLKSHKKEHPAKKPFSCYYCPENFSQLQLLNEHFQVHDVELPEVCSVCNKRFARKTHLTQHVQERSLVTTCGICEKKFCNQNDLKRHIETYHRNIREMPSLCKQESKEPNLFLPCSEGNMIQFLETGKRICLLCKQEFVDWNMTKTHNCVQPPEKLFSCKFCSRTFSQLSHLKTHLHKHKDVKVICL